jgi:hypothetical protein
MSIALPAVALTVLGILIALLGLFAAGDVVIVVVGLGAIFAAGLLGALDRRRA